MVIKKLIRFNALEDIMLYKFFLRYLHDKYNNVQFDEGNCTIIEKIIHSYKAQ